MKHKKTPSAPSRRRPFWDVRGNDLADCNEQELQKEGFRSPQPFMRNTACASQSQNNKESYPKQEATLPVKRSESLPHTNTDVRPPKTDHEQKRNDPEQSAYTAFTIPKEPKRASSSLLFRIILIGSLLLAVILLSVSLWLCSWFFSDSEEEPPLQSERPNAEQIPPKDQATVLNPSEKEKLDVLSASEIYAKSVDSVVSVLTESETASGVGSGFFISENGYLATACHVVDGMNHLTVQLSDGEQFSAKLVAKNDLTDLAVLKIDATNLPFLSFGKSNELLVGDRVFAIGTPASIDYAGSLGSGEVSYLNRTVKIPNESDGSLKKSMILIQTNVPLNPGNSGGPLLNEHGQVIGIVSMKLGNQYDGIGFAIPSDGALPILQAMVQGEIPSDELLWAVSAPAARLGIFGQADEENGRLGVRILDFDTEDDLDVPLILQKGDLILRIDTKEVSSPSQLRQVLQQKKPKQSVRITVLRYGQELTFDITLGK